MLSLLLFLSGVAVTFLLGYITYREDAFRKRLLPVEDISIFKWLQSGHQWHSLGHYFMDFTITFTIAIGFSVSIVSFFIPKLILLIMVHPIVFGLLCAIPSTLITLYIEIVADGHWRILIGDDDDPRDFVFDLVTHFSGGLTAAL